MAIAPLLVLLMALSTTPVAAETAPYLVKNINQSGSSFPAQLTSMGGRLFFTAYDGVHGRELWVSDGTASGTRMVKDIDPSTEDYYGLGYLTAIPELGLVFFNADDGVHGRELWVSDGTEAGTRMISDVPGSWPGGSIRGLEPYGFAEYNGLAYFAGTSTEFGREIWRSDGTLSGTQQVTDLTPGAAGSHPEIFVEFKNRLYFLRHAKGLADVQAVLYRTDGTSAGTKAVRDRLGNKIKGTFTWDGLWAVGEHLFIGRNSKELWVSGGTPATTRKIADTGTRSMVDLNGAAYFAWYNDKTGTYPVSTFWSTDGSAAGTDPITYADGTSIGWASYGDGFLSSFGDKVAFFDDYEGLSVSDGTQAGTHSLGLSVGVGGDRRQLPSLDDTLYFHGQTYDPTTGGPTPPILWRSDGTAAGTYAVSQPMIGGLLDQITVAGDGLFFVAREGKGVELWRYAP
jgi:ELWxxDGT repeat protein